MGKHDTIFRFMDDLEKEVRKLEKRLEKGEITEEIFVDMCRFKYVILWDRHYNDSNNFIGALISFLENEK
jgi:hypothetical protein